MPRVEVATVELNGPDTRWHCAVRESVAVVCHMLWTYTEAGLLLCALEISHGFLERRWHIPSADGEVEVEGIRMARQVMEQEAQGTKSTQEGWSLEEGRWGCDWREKWGQTPMAGHHTEKFGLYLPGSRQGE